MKMISAFARLLVLTLSLAAAVAHADVLLDTTDQLIAASPTQLGRLSRNGVPQDWGQSEDFPGVVNPASNYHYKTYVVPAGVTRYVQVMLDSSNPNLFVSAYLTSYSPNSAGAPNFGFDTNWQGDAGFSGPTFGVDPTYLNVLVPLNASLVVVVSETTPSAGLDSDFRLIVEGYTDSSFTSTTAAPASITLVSNLNPAPAGSAITLTATVTDVMPPNGRVMFRDGTAFISGCGAVPLSGGSGFSKTAQCVTTLSPGSHDLTAVYLPLERGATRATSEVLVQVVNPRLATTTTVVSSPNPSLSKQFIQITATVTGSSPTGSVAFVDTTLAVTISNCAAVPLVGSGNVKTAVCSTNSLAVGVHAIDANYSGDPVNAPSTGSASQTVNACVGRGC